jgi:hypothetical protein
MMSKFFKEYGHLLIEIDCLKCVPNATGFLDFIPFSDFAFVIHDDETIPDPCGTATFKRGYSLSVLEGSPRWEAETSLAHLLFSAL